MLKTVGCHTRTRPRAQSRRIHLKVRSERETEEVHTKLRLSRSLEHMRAESYVASCKLA